MNNEQDKSEPLRSSGWLGRSCVGCKYLYGQGHGYSNYTWEETTVRCALDRNQALSMSLPLQLGGGA